MGPMILQETPLGSRYCMDCCVGAEDRNALQTGAGWQPALRSCNYSSTTAVPLAETISMPFPVPRTS